MQQFWDCIQEQEEIPSSDELELFIEEFERASASLVFESALRVMTKWLAAYPLLFNSTQLIKMIEIIMLKESSSTELVFDLIKYDKKTAMNCLAVWYSMILIGRYPFAFKQSCTNCTADLKTMLFLGEEQDFEKSGEILSDFLSEFITSLQGGTNNATIMIPWSVIPLIFHSKLHRTNHTNHLVAIAQNNFNSRLVERRGNAFSAWNSLIWHFCHLRTLSSPKIDMLLVPILNALESEKNERVLKLALNSLGFFLSELHDQQNSECIMQILLSLSKSSILERNYCWLLVPMKHFFTSKVQPPKKSLLNRLVDEAFDDCLASSTKREIRSVEEYRTFLDLFFSLAKYVDEKKQDSLLFIFQHLASHPLQLWKEQSAEAFSYLSMFVGKMQANHSTKLFSTYCIFVADSVSDLDALNINPGNKTALLFKSGLEGWSHLLATTTLTHSKLKILIQRLHDKLFITTISSLMPISHRKPKDQPQKSPQTPQSSMRNTISNPFQVCDSPPIPSPDLVKIPVPNSKPKHRILTEKQLERQESQTNIGLRYLYNGLIQPSPLQPTVLSTPFKKHKLDEEVTSVVSAAASSVGSDTDKMDVTSESMDFLDRVQDLIARKDSIKDLTSMQLISLSKNLSILLHDTCGSLSSS
jgi:hypothetical protein